MRDSDPMMNDDYDEHPRDRPDDDSPTTAMPHQMRVEIPRCIHTGSCCTAGGHSSKAAPASWPLADAVRTGAGH
ncbi:MAG: hypothetical protein ACR2P1_14525 [Pseudomonadales bacterium]